MIIEQEWRKRSLCRGSDTEMFFVTDEEHPTRHRTPEEAAAIAFCNRCPVAGNCLNWALGTGEKGIWGGTTTRERRLLKRPGIRSNCVRCGNRAFEIMGEYQICLSCGLSKLV